ncbi:MAG: phosphate ABC transporter permease PstA [Kofleriaceae bacterium]|nr:MAG: phosphate ABC transporter permease PstA [Kofleriaceae bacterium]MBZ0237456.1 phosphate ABC transporter permease PstA [Kofleriaceae bacterium]
MGVFATSRESRRRHRTQTIAFYVLMAVTVLLVLPVIAILGLLFIRGAPALSLEFLFSEPLRGMTAGGIWPAIVGTMWLVGVSLLVSAPIGVLAAVYLNEYAGDTWVTRIIHLAIVNLAGVPSIVHALFGVGAFVLFFQLGTSILSASLTLAIMTLPVIIASTKEALSAVPMSFREACWNVGASRWQTIRHVVLPNSIAGILTGVILQVSRAAGETAPIIFTGAAVFIPFLPQTVHDQTMALSMHLFTLSTQVQGVPQQITYGTALVLVLMVVLINGASIIIRSRIRRRRKW